MSNAKQAGKWRTQKGQSRGRTSISTPGIHSDDVGIFVTCDKGQEQKCLQETHDLLSQYLEESRPLDNPVPDTRAGLDDIESDIQAELDALKPSSSTAEQISLITLDIPCVSFVRLPKDADPVAIVRTICEDAAANPDRKRSRYIKRLTPMTRMRKTLGSGLEQLCELVLPAHFSESEPPQKFAIRPTVRNNSQLARDVVIRTVADAVGPRHHVDLTHYDCLILVDVYRNVCGMSVVGNDFDRLKRYNLAEIYSPTTQPRDSRAKTRQGSGAASEVSAEPSMHDTTQTSGQGTHGN